MKKKMYDGGFDFNLNFTTADGFLNVHEGLEEMIKYLANEPSMGLYFVQQHAHNAMPNLLNLKDKVVQSTREATLQTEDLEDSIVAVRSMSECGIPIADHMIQDISRTLHLISTSVPRRGLIQNPSWGETSHIEPSSSYNYSLESHAKDDLRSQGYLSSVFNSAKQKAVTRFGWSHQIVSTNKEYGSETLVLSSTPPVSSIAADNGSDLPSIVTDEQVLVSGRAGDHQIVEQEDSSQIFCNNDTSSAVETYEQLTFEREAKLKKWLEEI